MLGLYSINFLTIKKHVDKNGARQISKGLAFNLVLGDIRAQFACPASNAYLIEINEPITADRTSSIIEKCGITLNSTLNGWIKLNT